MITAITGMPGDGKSRVAAGLICKDLIAKEVFVVSSVKMRLPRLHEYVTQEREKRGAKEPWDLDKRFLQITDSQAFEFFRYRSGGLVLDSSPDVKDRDENNAFDTGKGRMPKKIHDEKMLELFAKMRECEEYRIPVHYYIDEVHEIFPSREWATGGRGVLYYTSKHRHLHDEIFLITQQIGQVEKQLRDLISETMVCRNHIRRNVSIFKAKPIIKVRMYYGLPSPTSKPFGTEEIELDAEGVASCYKTAGALGVHDAPETITNKGRFPWWMMYVIGGVCMTGLFLFMSASPFIPAFFHKTETAQQPAKAATLTVPVQQQTAASVVIPPPQQVPTLAKEVHSEVFVRHVIAAHGPDRITVTLSDGRVYDENSRVSLELFRNGVKIGEKFYRLANVGPGHEEKNIRENQPAPQGASGRLDYDAAPGEPPKPRT